MSYLPWTDLIGRTSEDPEVLKLLADEGVDEVPPPERDEVTTTINFGACTLWFTDESQFPERRDLDDGMSVLTGVTITIRFKGKPDYTGPLPFGIDPNDSPDDIRQRFGERIEEDDDEEFGGYDKFAIEDRWLSVGYLEGREYIEGISVSLPDE
jgi:hypothetical protein